MDQESKRNVCNYLRNDTNSPMLMSEWDREENELFVDNDGGVVFLAKHTIPNAQWFLRYVKKALAVCTSDCGSNSYI